jgi:DNA repair exonuclease SbcCD ATPase subunit
MNSISQIRQRLEQRKGQRTEVEQTITNNVQAVKDQERSLRRHEEAREIIRITGQKTQNQLSFHIKDITSLAMEAVFNNPYGLAMEFVNRRNKTECDLYFERDGNRVEPLDGGGGGAADVASFALRVASWSLQRPHTRNVLLLDEPFKHLKGENENRRVLEMLRKISQELKMQIIMVSDERISRETTIEATDRLFEVSIRSGISKITVS